MSMPRERGGAERVGRRVAGQERELVMGAAADDRLHRVDAGLLVGEEALVLGLRVRVRRVGLGHEEVVGRHAHRGLGDRRVVGPRRGARRARRMAARRAQVVPGDGRVDARVDLADVGDRGGAQRVAGDPHPRAVEHLPEGVVRGIEALIHPAVLLVRVARADAVVGVAAALLRLVRALGIREEEIERVLGAVVEGLARPARALPPACPGRRRTCPSGPGPGRRR